MKTTPLRLSTTTTTVTPAAVAVFFFSFFLAGTARAHRLLPQTANVTLFADAACAEPITVADSSSFVLLLAVDTCGGAAAAGGSYYRALAVNHRPWCADGERPALNLYADAGCGGVAVAVASSSSLLIMPGEEEEGEEEDACVAPGEGFRGMVFSCEGGLEGGGIETTTMSAGISPATTLTEDGSGSGSGSGFATATTGGVVASGASTQASTETTATESSSASATVVPSRGATVSRIRSGPLFASALVIAAVAI
ncbi:hypothetical protein F5X96DRAFT_432560 [Biscogniauxia mediterranea]|nr:hypothetical protein F5X96DRAFT_432560 [Biscogniauxia mediterranea]